MKSLLFSLFNFLPAQKVFAHCDIPCGIYDPKPAQIAATTVLKMVQKLKEAHVPEGEKVEDIEYTKHHNDVVRMIMVKEQHAELCKKEILILWTDYFKPEHLEKFPNIHDMFWKAAKLCSKNKQSIDLSLAQELVKAIDEIAAVFQKTKQAGK